MGAVGCLMLKWMLVAAGFGLVGCTSEADKLKAAEAALSAEAQSAVAAQLLDPTSPLFTDLHVSTRADQVCGYVNGKNRYGAYVGKKRFVWVRGGFAILEVEPDPRGKASLADVNACMFDAQYLGCVTNDPSAKGVSQCIPGMAKEPEGERPRTRQEAKKACLKALNDRFNTGARSGQLSQVMTTERYDYDAPGWKIQTEWMSDTASGGLTGVGECMVPSSGDVKVSKLGID